MNLSNSHEKGLTSIVHKQGNLDFNLTLSKRFQTLASDDMESDSSSLASDKGPSCSTSIRKTSNTKHIPNGKETQQTSYRHNRRHCTPVDVKDHHHKKVVLTTSELGKHQALDTECVGFNPDVHVVDEHFNTSQCFLREPNVGDKYKMIAKKWLLF